MSSNTFKNPLEGLIEVGTITEEQEAAVKSAFDAAKKSHMMPPSPPPQFNQDEDSNPIAKILDCLVTDGTITEEQQSAIKGAFESAIKAYETQLFSEDSMFLSSFDSGLK